MAKTSEAGRVYGWRPPLKDHRDLKLNIAMEDESNLPQVIDMRPEFPLAYDQGNLGTCGPNSGAALIHRQAIVTDYPWKYVPSRLFMYYNTRMLEGTIDSDSGVSLRDLIKAINIYGVCPEQELDGTFPDWLCPYSDDSETFKKKPDPLCYKDAVLHKALKYQSINLNRVSILNTLAAKRPFAFGFMVKTSFESKEIAETGVMSVPKLYERLEGGHAVVAVGYMLDTPMGHQRIKDWVIVRNSWGTTWGDRGYFYMPLDKVMCDPYTTDEAWTIDLIGYEK